MEEMDREDYLDVIQLIRKKLFENGLGDIADDTNYYKLGDDQGYYLPDPQTHAILLLQAFQRHLNVNSRETIDIALAKIRKYSQETFPKEIAIERVSRTDIEEFPVLESDKYVELTSVPERKNLNNLVEELINQFSEPTEEPFYE